MWSAFCICIFFCFCSAYTDDGHSIFMPHATMKMEKKKENPKKMILVMLSLHKMYIVQNTQLLFYRRLHSPLEPIACRESIWKKRKGISKRVPKKKIFNKFNSLALIFMSINRNLGHAMDCCRRVLCSMDISASGVFYIWHVWRGFRMDARR